MKGAIEMDMAAALADLGVTSDLLDDATRQQLDRDGFAPLAGLLSPQQVEAFRTRLAELSAAEGDQAAREAAHTREAGTDRLADLVNKDPMFDVCFTHPRLLAAIAHVLGDFKLSSLNYRAALPGQGHQRLHQDWHGAAAGPDGYQVANSIWLLDDFTPDNGATRLVPGTHRRGKPADELADPSAAHPDEVLLTAPAGTVVVFNSHLWHAGTRNTTDRPRRAVHSYFTRRHHEQQTDQAAYLRAETRDRLTPAALFILGV